MIKQQTLKIVPLMIQGINVLEWILQITILNMFIMLKDIKNFYRELEIINHKQLQNKITFR